MNKMGTRGTMAASCISFFALGVITAALGPALPELAARSNSSLAAVGVVITALFLGALGAQAIAGPLNDRLGQRPVLIVRGQARLLDEAALSDIERVRSLIDDLESKQSVAELLDSAREAGGFTWPTLAKLRFSCASSCCSVPPCSTFATKAPPGASTSTANSAAISTSATILR